MVLKTLTIFLAQSQRSVFLIVGSVGLTLSAGALASDPGNAVTRNAVALAVGLSEGTIMAAWTSTVRSLFGEKRFGLHLAVYNSALAIGSSFFNGFAAVATKISDDATDAENAENEGNYVFPTTCRRRSPDLVRETCV